MKTLLISFHGLPGTGKDSAANILLETGTWAKVSFAGPLKQGVSTMFGIPMSDIENPKIKNEPNYMFGRSIRYILQTIGTQWGIELISPTVWVDLAEKSIRHLWAHDTSVVNTDLRFNNEAERIKSLGGYVIHIIRPNNEFANKAATTGMSNHASDAGIDSKYVDYTIVNDSTLEHFHEELQKVFKQIIEKME